VFKLLVAGFENNFQEFLVSRSAAYVLWEAVSFAGKANRTAYRIGCCQNLLKNHLVPPLVAKIIDVEHGIARCRQDGTDFCSALIDGIVVFGMLGHAPVLAVFLEPMKMAIRPAYDMTAWSASLRQQ
jgi:hypothetical protein